MFVLICFAAMENQYSNNSCSPSWFLSPLLVRFLPLLSLISFLLPPSICSLFSKVCTVSISLPRMGKRRPSLAKLCGWNLVTVVRWIHLKKKQTLFFRVVWGSQQNWAESTDFSHTPCLPTCRASPHQYPRLEWCICYSWCTCSGMSLSPQVLGLIRVQPWCCSFCGFCRSWQS